MVVLVHDAHDPAAVGRAPVILVLVLKVNVELAHLGINENGRKAWSKNAN